jgi:hypothetical protein
MTIETYNKATKILEEKQRLEDGLKQLREKILLDFSYIEAYTEISNKLFNLGQEFAAL